MVGWEKCINSFRVEFDCDCDIYITSSNAKLLSGELATYLAGRYVEFSELYHTVFPDSDSRTMFTRYLTAGGMPYLSNLRYAEQPSYQYLQDLYNSVVLKDVVKRNSTRDVDLLEGITAYITANVGTIFSATAISKHLKSEGCTVAPETILNYIKACEDAFLFYRVRRQNLQGKKILTANEKYYITDHGIREAVFGGNMKDINLFLRILYIWNSCGEGIKSQLEK
ncbi:ATP-binding protein [Irregularibacter muris]|uniref:ATP-binding protein n=1 Tax=Irregularibacter muris TaxID=1796619 RepID=UPI004032BDDA